MAAEKTPREICRRWNWDTKRTCKVPCAFAHVCSVCGSADHPARSGHPGEQRPPRSLRTASTTVPTNTLSSSSAEAERLRGCALYREGQFERARRAFACALALLRKDDLDPQRIATVHRISISMGMCHAALGEVEAALSWFGTVAGGSCSSGGGDETQRPQPELLAKALFQRGKLLHAQCKLGAAEQDLRRAADLVSDPAIVRELAAVRTALAADERTLCQRMLAASSQEGADAPDATLSSDDFFEAFERSAHRASPSPSWQGCA